MSENKSNAIKTLRNSHPADAFEALYGDTFVVEIAELLDIELHSANASKLRDALLETLSAYAEGDYDLRNYQPEKVENAALEKVSRKAEDLIYALNLSDIGRAEKKLTEAIEFFKGYKEGSSPRVLRELVSKTPYNRFRFLRQMLADLWYAADQSINRKPELDDELAEVMGEAYKQEQLRKWRERSARHRIPKDHALQEMISTLRDHWPHLTSRPFTEGMHHSDQGSTVSLAVDVIEAFMSRLDPSVPRSQIVHSVRKVREKASQTEASS